jgi:hypothetical protein
MKWVRSTLLIFSMTVISAPLWAAEELYLLSPESGSKTLQLLKLDFEKYLSKHGEYSFHPFNQEKELQELIENRPQAIVFMPAESYRKVFHRYRLTAVAVGTVNGVALKQHLLVGRQGSSRDALQGAVVMPFSEEVGRDLLEQLLGKTEASKLEILTVPKGVDALMSVGFGMAELALTDLHSFEQVAKINGQLVGQLSQLAVGADQFNTVISVPERKVLSKELLSVLMEMKESAEGRRLLQFLEIEGWKPPSREELIALERMR